MQKEVPATASNSWGVSPITSSPCRSVAATAARTIRLLHTTYCHDENDFGKSAFWLKDKYTKRRQTNYHPFQMYTHVYIHNKEGF